VIYLNINPLSNHNYFGELYGLLGMRGAVNKHRGAFIPNKSFVIFWIRFDLLTVVCFLEVFGLLILIKRQKS